ncbi:sensor histidine kinase [Gephyromycinifex aptenodytis]|uniref:sensor histidine kinase n=1 Tax=Gephyromycinifex aptenodytis TaxID=2716227 RepID=UPI00144682A3|nr:sensor histidine kinase [Gephyromycinifex aptenodytis]
MRRLTALRGWIAQRPMAGDAVLMVLLSPLILSIAAQTDLGTETGRAVPLLMFALFTLPLLWRRTAPVGAAWVLVLAHLLQIELIDIPSGSNVTAPVILYAVARWSKPGAGRRSIFFVAIAGSALGALRWSAGATYGGSGAVGFIVNTTFFLVLNLSVVAASWLLGSNARQRAAALEQVRDKARAAEREREQGLRIAAQEERARIAREMHDIVAHSLSVIVVQADGAAYALGGDSERGGGHAQQVAEQALMTIGNTAREALADTRRLVAVLRDESEQTLYTPAAGVESLDELIQPLRAAGRDIALGVHGQPRELPRGANLAVYRVVQESLTNVIKHAGPSAAVEISLDYQDALLVVSVRDDGLGVDSVPDGAGHGLVGMRERVAAFGGTLHVGPRQAGGFEVTAHLPYDQQ